MSPAGGGPHRRVGDPAARRLRRGRRRARSPTPSRAADRGIRRSQRVRFPGTGARATRSAGVRDRQQLLQRELGDRAGLVHRGPRRARADVQRPVVLVVPLQGRAGTRRPRRPGSLGLLLRLTVAGTTPTAARLPTPSTAASSRTGLDPRHRRPRARCVIDYRRAAGHLRRRHAVLAGARPPTRSSAPAFGPLPGATSSSAPAGAAGRSGGPARGDPRGRRSSTAADPDDARRRRHLRQAEPGRTPRTGRGRARPLRLEGQARPSRRRTPGAFNGDIGITSSLLPNQDCTRAADRLPRRSRRRRRPSSTRPSSAGRPSTRGPSPVPARRDVASTTTGERGSVVRRDRLRRVPHADADDRHRRRSTSPARRPDDPPVHRPAAARHGRGARRRPPRLRGDRHRVADAAAVGASA